MVDLTIGIKSFGVGVVPAVVVVVNDEEFILSKIAVGFLI